MSGIASDITMPGLTAALARRGITLDQDARAVLVRCADVTEAACAAALGRGGPVIALVRDSPAIVAALDGGADDALLTTATAEEIAARIAARLRGPGPPIGIGELIIDRIARRVTRAGRSIALLPREYALLLHLAQHVGQAVPRAALLEAVWGLRFDPGTNVVAVHVSRLRGKLDREFATPMLHTEKGVGYRLIPA